MIIRTTLEALELAMTETSKHFGGNITYRRGPDLQTTDGRTLRGKLVFPTTRARYALTITVRDSKGQAVSRDPVHGRRIAAACWHAHGVYFERVLANDPDAVIRAGMSGAVIDRNGGNWNDYGRGSLIYPTQASEWCDHGPGRYAIGRTETETANREAARAIAAGDSFAREHIQVIDATPEGW